MAHDLELTLMLADYHRTRPLLNGEVRAEGIKLQPCRAESGEACMRPVYEEFDIAEMSLSWYMMARCRKEPVIALPIFPLRMQIHPYIFCSPSSGIERPEDLKGKKIGMDEYRLTVGLWARGFSKSITAYGPKNANGTRRMLNEPAISRRKAQNHRGRRADRKAALARPNRRVDPAQYRAVVPRQRSAHSPAVQGRARHGQRLLSQDQNLSDHPYLGHAPNAFR